MVPELMLSFTLKLYFWMPGWLNITICSEVPWRRFVRVSLRVKARAQKGSKRLRFLASFKLRALVWKRSLSCFRTKNFKQKFRTNFFFRTNLLFFFSSELFCFRRWKMFLTFWQIVGDVRVGRRPFNILGVTTSTSSLEPFCLKKLDSLRGLSF